MERSMSERRAHAEQALRAIENIRDFLDLYYVTESCEEHDERAPGCMSCAAISLRQHLEGWSTEIEMKFSPTQDQDNG